VLAGLQPTPANAARGFVYSATAVVTAMQPYTTSTGIGGPLLWNGSNLSGQKGVTAFILGVGFGVTTASAAAVGIGICGGDGQTAAPTSTTAIDLSGPLHFGSQQVAQCTVYRKGNVTNLSYAFLNLGQVHTGAVNLDTADDNFIHLGGMPHVHAGSWCAVASSAVMTTAVLTVSLVWLEVPND
jgi:hypothetical protein